MAKKFPKISVVMLNYNGIQYLKRTIAPILNLDYPNYEAIVVDNGSTDGSIKYLESLNRIRLIRSPRIREKNFACNYAIKEAKGDFILLLDNDLEILNQDMLNNLIKEYQKEKKIGCLGLAFVDKDNKESSYYGGFLNQSFIKKNKPLKLEKIKKMHLQRIGFPHGAALFIKKSVWEEIGGYDENLRFGGDDNDIGMRLWMKGYDVRLYSKDIQKHIGAAERMNNDKYKKKLKETTFSQFYTIVKDFAAYNMIIILIGFSVFSLIKSVKQSIFRKNVTVLLSFFTGCFLFIKNLDKAIKKRKEVQSERINKEDLFLKMKPLGLSEK